MSLSEKNKLGIITATIVSMNAMIGAGVFTIPSALAFNVGPAGILAYVFVIASVWCLAQVMATLAAKLKVGGSFYAYANVWGGHVAGLLAVSSYIIGLLVGIGLLVQIAGSYLHGLIPTFSPNTLGITLAVILTFLNAVGVKLSKLGQHILIACTVFPLVTIIIIGFKHASLSNFTPFAPHGFENVLAATKVVIFSFFGFESASSLFSIVRDPERNIPKTLTYSIGVVSTLYFLFAAAIISSIPMSLFMGERELLTNILTATFPGNQAIIMVVHFAILSAIAGTLHSMIWATSHLSMTTLGKFKNKHVKTILNKGYFNNSMSAIMIGALTILTAMTLKNINLFFSFTALFILIAIATAIPALFKLKLVKGPGMIIKTVIGCTTIVMMCAFSVQGILEAFAL